jgi:hypothetical protein
MKAKGGSSVVGFTDTIFQKEREVLSNLRTRNNAKFRLLFNERGDTLSIESEQFNRVKNL